MTEVKEKNIYEQLKNTDKFIVEDLSFDSIMQNPVLKPLAEINRTILDLEEMNNKRLTDADRDFKWCDAISQEIPRYSESIFISRLWRLHSITGDIVKTQDIEIKTLKRAINEMLEIIRKYYGVIAEEEKKTVKKDSFNYEDYLSKLIKESDQDSMDILKNIYTNYLNERGEEKIRFENACAKIFKEEENKDKKLFISKVLRKEILLKGGA